jgi:hypothetical protein
MKLKTCSRPQADIIGLAAALLALLLLQAVLLGGSLALRSQSNRQSAHRDGATEAMLSLGAIVFVVIGAGRGWRRGLLASLQAEAARRGNE